MELSSVHIYFNFGHEMCSYVGTYDFIDQYYQRECFVTSY